MKELIEKLRNPTDGLRYNDGNGLLKEAADEIERLTAENLRLAGEVSNRNSRALAGDTATKQFDAMYEDIERLTAERDAAYAAGRESMREDALRLFEPLFEQDYSEGVRELKEMK